MTRFQLQTTTGAHSRRRRPVPLGQRSRRPLAAILAAAAVATALSLWACDNESSSDGAQVSPAPSVTQAPIRSGDELVDKVIAGVLAGRAEALSPLFHPAPVGCSTSPNQVASLPCAPGEPEGSTHEVLATGGCQPTYISAAAGEQVLRQALAQDFRLYAVSVAGTDRQIIFANLQGGGAFVFRLDSVGIVSFGGACGQTAAEAVEPGSTFLVPPQF